MDTELKVMLRFLNSSEVNYVRRVIFDRFLLDTRRSGLVPFKLVYPASQSFELRLFQSNQSLGNRAGVTHKLFLTCIDCTGSPLCVVFRRLGGG